MTAPQVEDHGLLRFLTCGSVDDGKSTLIGRLLYDSKMIFEDQLAALENDSKKVGTQGQEIDFALLVDGLAAEREQGLAILDRVNATGEAMVAAQAVITSGATVMVGLAALLVVPLHETRSVGTGGLIVVGHVAHVGRSASLKLPVRSRA